ncbi:protein WHAT'S THIS FACTOR 1 homolog, chloroplastic [Elaeis guineensis]|uniref:Protein WHAT'S THIS FACTOR 1, chloroplastic n=1 Tax=Elaeis guineensis var. tenera TaxID=51953 RepID=A0A6I9QRH4_ELAGV|nr:protein WHAT'S THIS FACTOR 1, chloroplastic [Elaeis guineensis]
MDPKLLLSSHRTFPPGPFPLSLAQPSSSRLYLHKPSVAPRAHLSFPLLSPQNSSFLGKNLVVHENKLGLGQKKKPLPFTRVKAVVKRRKEMPFDTVIERDKKLKLVLKIRNILIKQPDRIMNLRDLGRFRRDLGLTRKRRFIALLKRFPGVFEIVEEGVYSLRFRMTPEAERVYLEELRVRNEMEQLLVVKLRKLLMMSLNKRILIEKIAHLKTDLGLPVEFRNTICERYPQYFKVVSTDCGPALELTHWDPELAVSAAEMAEEENRIREIEERNLIIDRPPKFKRVKLPRGLNVSKGEMRRICQFRDMPYISPYSDFSELRSGTPEKEKHACGVVHEILSFTLEKRTLVDHLTHFREEFRFSQQLRGMLIRHPDMFYVSLKGDRDSVFLREAYRDSQLIEKDRLLLLKEKMRALVAIPRFPGRGARKSEVAGKDNVVVEGGGEESDEQLSDVDSFLNDELGSEFDEDDDDVDDDEDDWSDEDDDLPPDFDDGESLSFEEGKSQSRNISTKTQDKVLVPVFPDGRPRERW